MKKIILFFAVLLTSVTIWAQSPFKMSYQAVIRNSDNQLIKNQDVGIKISVLQGSSEGNTVYAETQTPSTNTNGLITIEIGTGAGDDDFTSIVWSDGPYFVKTEIDPSGGTDYSITATSQLLSVPYALYANVADSISGDLTEKDPVFNAWDKSTGISIKENQISNLKTYLTVESDPLFTASLASKITAPDTSNWNNKQDMLIAGNKIDISDNTIRVKPEPFFLGQDTLGGIVYYIYLDDLGQQHGLIVSKTEDFAAWQSTTSTTNATTTWDGSYNTGLMTNSPARVWVEALGTGWYLPSIDELNILWDNRFIVNKSLNAHGYGLLSTTGYYWSSTEFEDYRAYIFMFMTGFINYDDKTFQYKVRGIKAF